MARLTFSTPIVILLAGLVAIPASAQFWYKTGIDVVGLTATVVDREGEPVTSLAAQDFEVREDGVLQEVTYFSAGHGDGAVPLHVGLLFDTSESMEREMAFSRNAAVRFLNTFPKAFDFTLVEFADEVRAARFSQAEFPRLVERIRNNRAKGQTALYDAITVYLGSAFEQNGRKVLVVYTDGGDTSSSRTWTETLRTLRASDVTVYSIGFMASQSSRFLQQSKLMELARLTGGRAVFPGNMKELEPMYASIAAEINAQYSIGYVSTNTATDGKWRKVDVKLKRPSSERVQLRTREGYFGPAPR